MTDQMKADVDEALADIIEKAIDPACDIWWASDAAERVLEAIRPYLRTSPVKPCKKHSIRRIEYD